MMLGVIFFVFIMFGVCRASWISDLISLYSLRLILKQYHFKHCFCPNLSLLSSFLFIYIHPGSLHCVSYRCYALLFSYSSFSNIQSEYFLLAYIAEFANFLCPICYQIYLFNSLYWLCLFFPAIPSGSLFYTFHFICEILNYFLEHINGSSFKIHT